jgi:hypothetical protein
LYLVVVGGPMASSSSAAQSTRKRPHLPLIVCTECGRHMIIELEVKKEESGNRGRIFYKCPAHKVIWWFKIVHLLLIWLNAI